MENEMTPPPQPLAARFRMLAEGSVPDAVWPPNAPATWTVAFLDLPDPRQFPAEMKRLAVWLAINEARIVANWEGIDQDET